MIDLRTLGRASVTQDAIEAAHKAGLEEGARKAHQEARRAALAVVDEHIEHAVGLRREEHDSYTAELVTQIETLEKQRDERDAQISDLTLRLTEANSARAQAEAERDVLMPKKKR